jgi:hypothetical protein
LLNRDLEVTPIGCNLRVATFVAHGEAVEGAFGADVDYAMLIKLYGATSESAKGRYSPAECTRKTRIEGNPDLDHVSTSYAERSNLSVRMHTRRFIRLTNGFSKKVENHAHSVALFAMYYNFVFSFVFIRHSELGHCRRPAPNKPVPGRHNQKSPLPENRGMIYLREL